MKTINKSNFSGPVTVYNKSIFINIDSGEGFHKVFKHMKGAIHHFTKIGIKIYKNVSFEDVRQEICLFMLEGIVKYNPEKNTALSTFLHKYIHNKLIDKIREKKDLTNFLNRVELIDRMNSCFDNTINKIDIMARTSVWNNKWKSIIFRVFINGEAISSIAKEENMSSWGLSKAIRKKLKEAKNKGE